VRELVHPLVAQPTDEQACLLRVIYKGREQAGWPNYARVRRRDVERVGKPSLWPTFQYVEAMLYRDHQLVSRVISSSGVSFRLGGCQVR